MIANNERKINFFIFYLIPFSFVINIITAGYCVLLENLLSILVFDLFFILIGISFIFLFKKDNYINSIAIYFLFILIYGFNLLLQFYLNDNWNTYKDEILFFRYSSDMIVDIFNSTFFDLKNNIKYSAMIGYIYPAGIIAILSDYIDQNNIFVQKLFIVNISAFNAVVLYNIIQKYFAKNNALFFTIIYFTFSFMMFLSSLILRDQLVALFYLIFFYIFLNKNSIKNILYLIIIIFCSVLIRPETGIYLLLFFILYIYNIISSKQKYIKNIFFILLFMLCLVGYIYYYDKILLMYSLTVTSYGSLVNAQASSSSFGLVLYSLPYGLNYVTMPLFWQIQPFPFWSVFSKDLISTISGLQYVLSGFFWYLVIGLLMISILKYKILIKIDKKLLLLFIGSIIYIVLVSVIAPDARRLIAVYPILYLISIYSFMFLIKEKLKYILLLVTLYIILILIYIALKGFVI